MLFAYAHLASFYFAEKIHLVRLLLFLCLAW